MPKPSPSKAAAAKNVDATLTERGARYGTLMENGSISQSIKALMRNAPKWNELQPDQQEALDVITSKVARILTGDVTYADNWHDIAGYARLIDNRLTTGNERGT